MTGSDYDIALATQQDIQGIADLQESNLRSNGGALSVRFPREWFETAIAAMPIIVARSKGRIIGYVIATPVAAQAHVPIVHAMLRAYSGAPDSYIYGPICVAQSHRGRGVAAAMFEALKARLPGREGFTFIRADNTVSITVHAKMGLRELAEFIHEDTAYVVVGYVG
jgi:GNAT superfamily N-acetyltransferase